MREAVVTILKSEQILAESPVSWQDAVDTAIKRFAKTVRHVRSAYVNELTTVIDEGAVRFWRVNLQVTFEVDEPSVTAARRARATAAATARPARRSSAKRSKARKAK
jgi:flavin-binding protein dodecin